MARVVKKNRVSPIESRDSHPHLVIMMMKKEKHAVHHVY